jgi:hypothetical protein
MGWGRGLGWVPGGDKDFWQRFFPFAPGRRASHCAHVKTPAVKILGRLRPTPWERFARLQRTSAKLLRGRGQPKGVFRFASHEECDQWTAAQRTRN